MQLLRLNLCMVGFRGYVVGQFIQIIQCKAIERRFAGLGHDTQTVPSGRRQRYDLPKVRSAAEHVLNVGSQSGTRRRLDLSMIRRA
jgi:hypothetical protein